jgi:hypothetical protein
MKGADSGKAQGDVIASLSARGFRGDTGHVSVEAGSASSGVYEGSLSTEGTPGLWNERCSRTSLKAVLGGLGVSHLADEGLPPRQATRRRQGYQRALTVTPWVQ